MTPQGAKGAARQAAILAAAADVLARDGAHDFSLRRVAQAAGIRLGNLQYYFPTRADLLGHLLAGYLEAGLAKVSDVADHPSRMIDRLLAEHEDRAAVATCIAIWELAAHDDAVSAALRSFYDRYTTIVAEHIVRHRGGNGSGITPELHARARVLIALLEGSALLRSGVGGQADPEADRVLREIAVGLVGGHGHDSPR